MHRFLSFFLLLFAGCAIEQSDFVEEFAIQKCANIDACGKTSETHGTVDDCEQFYKIVADEEMVGDGCKYSSDMAKACLDELSDTEGECPVVDSLAPSCAKVGDCPDGGSGSDTGL